jgi:hypothetical protein
MSNETPVVFNEQETGLIKQQDNTMLNEIMRVEIDTAISTAKRFPRNLTEFKRKALSMATLDQETAESCFYTLPRAGKVIEGPSIRLAEIITSAWGNLRVYANVIANDRKTITARAYCHDLENNVAIGIENKRRITDKHGKTFTDDMQVVTGNAACKIALRNAVFSVIPMAYTKDIYLQVKKVAAGDINTLSERRSNALKHFKDLGVGYDRIYAVLGVKSDEDIDQEKLLILIGVANAVKDGDTTLEDAFPKLTPVTETQSKSNDALKNTVEEIAKAKNGGSTTSGKAYRSYRG